MKRILTLITLLLPLTIMAAKPACDIIPRPVSLEQGKGTYRLKANAAIVAPEALTRTAELFAEMVEPTLGGRLTVAAEAKKPAITLSCDPSLTTEEYRLDITRKGVTLVGGTPQAVLHGLQSLRQLVFQNKGLLPVVKISDKPYFAYRGMHLDVCRHFSPVEEVKEYIDMLSMHKVNTFHFHLTEDQGWRIEIKRYPELTRVGAQRNGTVVGFHATSDTYEEREFEDGFYTQDEIREIVAYAAERYITVIPEIEMPGHARAAVAAYPWLGCSGEQHEVWRTWGVSKEVFCVGKEATFGFLEDVLTEVLELFPSEYIHIGGDESPRDEWMKCPFCQEVMKKNGFKREAELQTYLNQRIENWLAERGRKLIGWDEILDGGVSPNATVMTWRGDGSYGRKAAKMGNKVIMTPGNYLYFDYYQTEDPETYEPEFWGTGRPDNVPHVTMRGLYNFNPFYGLNEDEQKSVLGVQANVWREYMPDFDYVQRAALPRMAALAEVNWTFNDRDFDNFKARMENLRRLYDSEGYTYTTAFFDGTDEIKPLPRRIVMTEQKQHWLAIGDARTGQIEWTWDQSKSGLPENHYKYFDHPTDVKPVDGGEKILLITGRATGLINVADHKVLWYCLSNGGSPHSAEILPDGNVVIAAAPDGSDKGSRLYLYKVEEGKDFPVAEPVASYPQENAHSAVWDEKTGLLWATTSKTVCSYEYKVVDGEPSLKLKDVVELPSRNAHDMYPVYGEDKLWITTHERIYKFDPATKTIEEIPYNGDYTYRIQPGQDDYKWSADLLNLKSITNGPAGWPTIVLRPTESWYSNRVTDLNGKVIFAAPDYYRIYKARWIL